MVAGGIPPQQVLPRLAVALALPYSIPYFFL